jgi:hypothetical protein
LLVGLRGIGQIERGVIPNMRNIVCISGRDSLCGC